MDELVKYILEHLKEEFDFEFFNEETFIKQVENWLPTIDEDEIVLHGYAQAYEWFKIDFNL